MSRANVLRCRMIAHDARPLTALLCFAAGAAAVATPASAQQLASELGGSLAQSCFEAAASAGSGANAIAECSAALEQPMSARDRAGTFVNRGILLMRAGRPNLAVQDYDEAITLDPGQAEAWLDKAITQLNARQASAAIELANHALELRTEKPALAYYIRGLAHEEDGQVSAAYADLRNAASLAPNWRDPAEQLKRYHVVQR